MTAFAFSRETRLSRSAGESAPPVFAFSVSTNCAFETVEGKADVKRRRCVSEATHACLFASSYCSHPAWRTTTPRPTSCVSGRNSWIVSGTGVFGMLPKAAL